MKLRQTLLHFMQKNLTKLIPLEFSICLNPVEEKLSDVDFKSFDGKNILKYLLGNKEIAPLVAKYLCRKHCNSENFSLITRNVSCDGQKGYVSTTNTITKRFSCNSRSVTF